MDWSYYALVLQFIEKSLVWHCIESFTKIKDEYVGLNFTVKVFQNIMSCCYKLRLATVT